MTIDIHEIKIIRKKLGLSQIELAKKAGVSQSLIAKIESGKLDPTYSKAKKIMNTLQDLGKKKETKAKDIMNTKVVSVSPSDSLKKAIKKMKDYEISQLPVMEDKAVMGFVSETSIMEVLLSGKTEKKVGDISKEAPPIVPASSSVSVVSSLLKHYPLVLVSDNGKVKGIITKSDLIRKLYT